MHVQTVVTSQRLVAALLVAILAVGPQVPFALAAAPAGNVTMRGSVAMAENAAAVTGARVYAIHLDTKQVYTSAPSAAGGAYELTALPYGYYDLAVETPEGLYLANRVINAPAGEQLSISLMLGPPQPEDTEWWSAAPDRRITGLDRVPDGVARIVEGKPRPLPVATTPGAEEAAAAAMAGKSTNTWLLPTAIGAGVVVLLLLLDDDDEETQPPLSPFTP